MNAYPRLSRIAFVFCIILALQTSVASAQRASVSFQVFYDQLSPYGTWVNYPSYGYVWMPFEDANFVPYGSNGHWVWTDDGWLWLSDYDWGWAPFHYGRWFYDDTYGWLWIPGNEWGPAWVCWRTAPGYYGWVALGPSVGVELFFGYNYYGGRRDSWVYMPERYMTSEHPSRYYGPRSGNDNFLKTSSVINRTNTSRTGNARYVSGPERAQVERATGSTISPVSVRESSTPGHSLSNNQLSIYRPAVNRSSGDKPAPEKMSNLKDIKPVSQRSGNDFFKQPGRASAQASPSESGRNTNNTQRNTPSPAHTTNTERPQNQAEHTATHTTPEPVHENPVRTPPPPRQEVRPPPMPHNNPPAGIHQGGPR